MASENVTNQKQHHCPTCRRRVDETSTHHQIAGHYDTNHEQCPSSFEPFWTTIVADYTPTPHEHAQLFDDLDALRKRVRELERAVKRLSALNRAVKVTSG